MHPDVYYTCEIRGCADQATDLHHYTFQNKPRQAYNCRTHYLNNLYIDANFDRWLDEYLSPE